MGTYRNYSDEDKASALAHYQATKSLRKTAAAYKMPASVLHLWVKNPDAPSAPSPESVREKKEDLAELFEQLAYSAVKHTSDTLELAKPGEACLIAAQSVDKMRLLREQATSITEDVSSTAKLDDLTERVRLRVVNGGSTE